MKQADNSSWKATFDIRKRPINGKLFQNQKTTKDEFILNPKKTLGKKYMQDSNIFKQKLDEPKKQHRQVVMSEQFIRSSKLYRLLRQKMERCDSMFVKEVNSLNEHKLKLKEEIVEMKSQNYQQKIGLWELKNRLMQLKSIYQQQQQENRRLSQRNYAQYQQQEGENQMQPGEQNQQEQGEEDNLYSQQNNQTFNRQEQQDILEIQYHQEMEGMRGEMPQRGEAKKEFSEILEELMSLKAERQRIEKQFSQQPQKEQEHKDLQKQTQFQSRNFSLNHSR